MGNTAWLIQFLVLETWEHGYILSEMNDRQALDSENDSNPWAHNRFLSSGLDDHSSRLRYIQALSFLKQKLHQSLLIYSGFHLGHNLYRTCTLALHLSLGSSMVRASHGHQKVEGSISVWGSESFSEYRAWRSFISINAWFIVSNIQKLKQCTDVKVGFNVTQPNLLWKCQRLPSATSAILQEKQVKYEVFLFDCNAESWPRSTPYFNFKDTVLNPLTTRSHSLMSKIVY